MALVGLVDGCPRCGGVVVEMAGDKTINCTASTCLAFWPQLKDFQTECIARDLSGTRVRRPRRPPRRPSTMTKAPAVEMDLNLEPQLEELVELVRTNTREQVLKEVHDAIGLSMKGRDTSTVKGTVETNLLVQMQNWIKRSMSGSDD